MPRLPRRLPSLAETSIAIRPSLPANSATFILSSVQRQFKARSILSKHGISGKRFPDPAQLQPCSSGKTLQFELARCSMRNAINGSWGR
jgi:hypothetical protein